MELQYPSNGVVREVVAIVKAFWEQTTFSHALDSRKQLAFTFLVRTKHVPFEGVPMEIVATVSWQCVVNYTEKTLYVHFFFFQDTRETKERELEIRKREKYKSEHDLQILYTSHFFRTQATFFCRKYFGLQTFVSYLNVLSVCIQ